MSRKPSSISLQQILFLLILLSLAILFAQELSFFIGAFLGALTIAVLLKDPYCYLVEKRKWSKGWAASFLMTVIAILLAGILWLLFHLIVSKLSGINLHQISSGIDIIRQKGEELLGYNIIPQNLVDKVSEQLAGLVTSIFNTTYSVVANLFMLFFLLYFMLTQDGTYKELLYDYMPLSRENKRILKTESRQMIYGNTIGIPLMMLAQGLFAGIGYWIFGLNDAFFWGIITGFFSIVPLIGTAVIWVPLTVYMFAIGEMWMALGLLIYGSLIITNVDNLFRFILMKRIADVHPMVTVLGVIVGIPMFGFWGIIFGPSLLSIFLLLIKIYRNEYLKPEV